MRDADARWRELPDPSQVRPRRYSCGTSSSRAGMHQRAMAVVAASVSHVGTCRIPKRIATSVVWPWGQSTRCDRGLRCTSRGTGAVTTRYPGTALAHADAHTLART